MTVSCNGCRVLRKACRKDCSIRPCLQGIKTPESQGNATVFLTKFYGRAGLLNLINAGPEHLRPAIFRCLLHEACGRIVDPIHGSAGLLSSGGWRLCQDAVDAVLRGAPMVQTDTALVNGGESHLLLRRTVDIRHRPRSGDVHSVSEASRKRFKRKRPGNSTAAASCGSHNYEGDNHEVKPKVAEPPYPLRRWPLTVSIGGASGHEPSACYGLKHASAGSGLTIPSADEEEDHERTESEETADWSMVTRHEEDTADTGQAGSYARSELGRSNAREAPRRCVAISSHCSDLCAAKVPIVRPCDLEETPRPELGYLLFLD